MSMAGLQAAQPSQQIIAGQAYLMQQANQHQPQLIPPNMMQLQNGTAVKVLNEQEMAAAAAYQELYQQQLLQ